MKLNESGVSMVQSLIGAALVGITSLVIMKQTEIGSKSARVTRQKFEQVSFENYVRSFLADTTVCTHNFSAINFPSLAGTESNLTTNLVNLDGTNKFAIGEQYHSGLLVLKQLDLVGFEPIEGNFGVTRLKISVERTGSEANSLGTKNQVSYINIISRSDGSGVLESCSAADIDNSHWQADSMGIHYSSGNVGVGIVDPKALLHVIGGYDGAGLNPNGLDIGKNALIVIENPNDGVTDEANAQLGFLVKNKNSKGGIQFSDGDDEGNGGGWDGLILYDHGRDIMSFTQRNVENRAVLLEDDGQVRIGYPRLLPPTDATASQYALDVSAQPSVTGGSGIRILGNETTPGTGRARMVFESGVGENWSLAAMGGASAFNVGGFHIAHRNTKQPVVSISVDDKLYLRSGVGPGMPADADIQMTGNVLINSRGDGSKKGFVINGDGFTVNGDSEIVGNLNVSGTVTASSDERLKEDITPLKESLKKIDEINPVSFYWRKEFSKDQRRQIGVLAQDIEKVFPELVQEDQRGNLSVNYSGLVAPLIDSVKALNQKIEAQQMIIEKQQKQIEMLLKR
ncbi:MAG: hypothetical protein CME65_01360 [Halobacteriovoraceae bacterium]|nr:hypothetical protein [Halobacteriovoraceae bacterium]|tara:strand:+ start:3186 stop:4892 length:1707 start_codon:yes stop_codon:yes gene_type:complete